MVLYNQESDAKRGEWSTDHDEHGTKGMQLQYFGFDKKRKWYINTLNYLPSQCVISHSRWLMGRRCGLNAKSSLRYPEAFTGDERVVYAEGEIYLEWLKIGTSVFT